VSVILDADDLEIAPVLYPTMFMQEVEKFCRNPGDLLGRQRGYGCWIDAGQTQLEHPSST
jgi:hypothetical protein